MTTDEQDTSDRPTDPTRRQFFRTFGRQTVAGAGNVIGAADVLRRGGTAAAGELLSFGFGSPQQNAARMQAAADAAAAPPPDPAARFSSPYAYSDEAVILLDQRALPERRETVTCHEPSEVAAALRAGVITGGPILAEVAAHTLVLAAAAAVDRPAAARRIAFETAAETLTAARPIIRAVGWAVERLHAVHDAQLSATGDTPPRSVIAALRREADAIAMEQALDHARLGRFGADAIGPADGADGPLNVLLHGEMGPLSCGLVGTGFAVLRSLLDAGHPIHAFVTDGGPELRGGSLTALQLRQLDVPHTVIPDAAVGWLLGHLRPTATVIRLDAIGPTGDALAPIGALAVARLAGAANVPVFGCATTAAVDFGHDRQPHATELAPPANDGESSPRLRPLADAVPGQLIGAIVTEEGVLRAPYQAALTAAVAARNDRRRAESAVEQPV